MDNKELAEQLRTRLGWVCMPLSGKKPIIDGWQKLKTSEHIRSWNKTDNIGLVTGAVSGVIVLDIDNKDGGVEDWNRYVAINGEPLTMKVRTGGGGFHYYFRYNERVAKIKSAARVAFDTDGRKMAWDIKNNGGQVVMPPSIHPDTLKAYEYEYSDHMIEMPEWILEIIRMKKDNPGRVQARPVIDGVVPETITGFHGFECVGINPDAPHAPHAVKVANPKTNHKNDNNHNEISKDALSDLLSLLKVERADNYDDWRNVIWAIKSVSTDYNELGHEFSRRCETKYDAAAVDKMWDEGNVDKEDKIGVGSLLYWLREDIGESNYSSFRQRHSMNVRTLTLSFMKPYNIYEEYYLDDFLRWACTQTFDDWSEWFPKDWRAAWACDEMYFVWRETNIH